MKIKQCPECYAVHELSLSCPYCNHDYQKNKITKNVNNLTFEEISNNIKDAFYRLGRFTEGRLTSYRYFGFTPAFNILFNEARKNENYTAENHALIIHYYSLIISLCQDYRNDVFEFTESINTDDFYKDCEELMDLGCRDEDFEEFGVCVDTGWGETEPMFSVNDIKLKNQSKVGNIESTKNVEAPASIFVNPDHANLYLSVLKNCKPPVINEAGSYIYSSRGKRIICAWFEVMERKSLVLPNLNRETKARLINDLIPALKISGKTLDAKSVQADYTQFSALFSRILSV